MSELKLSNKDAGIVKRNPGKSPYELKELGLSQSGFEKMMAQPTTAVTPIADSALNDPPPEGTDEGEKVVATPAAEVSASLPINTDKLIPKITEVGQDALPVTADVARRTKKTPIGVLPGQVLVTTPQGTTVPMGKEFAIRLVQNDNRYSIHS